MDDQKVTRMSSPQKIAGEGGPKMESSKSQLVPKSLGAAAVANGFKPSYAGVEGTLANETGSLKMRPPAWIERGV